MRNYLVSCFFCSVVAFQLNSKSLISSCPLNHIEEASLIKAEDLCKYQKAYNYISADPINKENKITVSDIIVDMDRFYFQGDVKEDTCLSKVIDSLNKYEWFDEFSSKDIYDLFQGQDRYAESILFFSLIEKNTLRADLFMKRSDLKEFRYDKIINLNESKVYAYLFFFDESGKIKQVYRSEIIYEI